MSVYAWIGVGLVAWIAVSIPTALAAGRWFAKMDNDLPELDGDERIAELRDYYDNTSTADDMGNGVWETNVPS